MIIHPNSETFSLLIIDVNKIYPRISLKQLLHTLPTQYCIVLNATYQDINEIRGTHIITPNSIHRPRSCVVLSRKSTIKDPTHTAQIDWDTIDNNPCLHIQIEGVNLLLAYLDPHSLNRRRDLLQKLEKCHFINTCGGKKDIHILIAYLDIKKAIEPDLLALRYRWQFVEANDDRSSFMHLSFHVLVNITTTNILYPHTLDIVEDTQRQIPPSAGIITHIPCLPRWEDDSPNSVDDNPNNVDNGPNNKEPDVREWLEKCFRCPFPNSTS